MHRAAGGGDEMLEGGRRRVATALEAGDRSLIHVEQLGHRRLRERRCLTEAAEGGLAAVDLRKNGVVAGLASGLALEQRVEAEWFNVVLMVRLIP